ncbi:hypothetical protein TSUD_400450 [Trifolium subterraneum]|uniref:Aminotransferase-like plant mobile domain-containing protein n=1 Tax=Trifolium subterraneum TaxID=3900 RepID=A0A2Z6NKB1_TRISU|nr:hypothetical protein TSUD_400450 [Trifolium subterraneum]
MTASERRKRAAENPHKKRQNKKPHSQAQDQAASDETAHHALEHHEGDPAEVVFSQGDAMEEGHPDDDDDNIVHEIEEDERALEEGDGDGGPAKVRHPTWVIPYDGIPEPKDCELIGVANNLGELFDCGTNVNGLKWCEATLKDIRLYELAQTRYSFLHLGFLATFVERWQGETNSFHMPNEEMTITLDYVRCLLHLPIQGRLLDHTSIPTQTDGHK